MESKTAKTEPYGPPLKKTSVSPGVKSYGPQLKKPLPRISVEFVHGVEFKPVIAIAEGE